MKRGKKLRSKAKRRDNDYQDTMRRLTPTQQKGYKRPGSMSGRK